MSAVVAPLTGRVTQTRLIRAEWTKFWTLRSTRWTLLVATALMLLGIVVAAAMLGSSDRPPDFNSIDAGVSGYRLAQLAIAVLGVLTITGEYSTGMIRASMVAAPARLPVLWAKVVVFSTVTFVSMLVAALIAFFGTQAVAAGYGLDHSISDTHALRTVVGAAMTLTGVGVFGVAIGALTRNTAAGISSIVAALYVLPGLLTLLPASISDTVQPYLPAQAAATVATTVPGEGALGTWTGLAVFAGYVVVLLGIAAVALRKRDV